MFGTPESPASLRFNQLFEPTANDVPCRLQVVAATERRAMKWVVFRELYVERCATRNSKTYAQNVHRVLDRFTSVRSLVERNLIEITNLDIDHYIATRMAETYRGKRLSARTINNEINILNAAFCFAGQRGPGIARHRLGLLVNPPFGELINEPDLAPVMLSDTDFAAAFRATEAATCPDLSGCSPRAFWTAVLLLDRITLLRRSALLCIPRPSDEMLTIQKQLLLPARFNKTRSDLFVSLGSRDAVAELFAALPSKVGEPLLPWRRSSGEPLSLRHFSYTFRQMQLRAGIDPERTVKLKHLRSTSATELGDRFNAVVAKKKLGHSPRTNTFETNYQSRASTSSEVIATDFLVDRFLESVAPNANRN